MAPYWDRDEDKEYTGLEWSRSCVLCVLALSGDCGLRNVKETNSIVSV